MQRSIFLAIAVLMLFGASANAQYIAEAPQVVSRPPRMVVATPPPPSSDPVGGFIGYIFGQRAAPKAVAVRSPAAVLVQPRQAPKPQYVNAAPVYSLFGSLFGQLAPGFSIDPKFMRQEVPYRGKESPGTLIVDTPNHFLYLVQEGGRALRYGVGVGRPGFTWSGTHKISAKKEWPDWVPPEQMLKRKPELPHYMAGGPENPLGARALYLGSTLYRIHGSNEPWTIGHDVSSGCIRMRNVDVIDLYNRVNVGTKVVVL
jgi:lipoprotein-anchoring transpeptidase ErfK/SrfK